MKPYYEHAGITIYHGDCREILPHLPEVDCCVTSPPYNLDIGSFSESGMHSETTWVKKISTDAYRDAMPEHEYQIWQTDVISGVVAILARHGSIFYNHKIRWRDGNLIHPVAWTSKFPIRLRQEIIWQRNGSVTFNAKMFPPNDERILWFAEPGHKWFGRAEHMSIWHIAQYGSFGGARASVHGHPCAFPTELPKRCIASTTEINDVVIDPFCGSGTTLIAAKDLGRRAIGIEVEEKYCELAAERLSQEVFQF